MPRNITEQWIANVKEAALVMPAVAIAQEMRFVHGLTVSYTKKQWEAGLDHTFVDLGYSPRGSKMDQLLRNYYVEEEVEKARESMKTRAALPTTSIAISMIGQVKHRSSQGHCLRATVVSYYGPQATPDKKPFLTVDIEYRTTEFVRKYGADLIFFHDVLIPELLKDNPWGIETPDLVRMYLPSAYFSLLYVPVLFRYMDPIEFLEAVLQNGPSTYVTRALYRVRTLFDKDPERYRFKTRRKMNFLGQELAAEGVIDVDAVKEYLEGLER